MVDKRKSASGAKGATGVGRSTTLTALKVQAFTTNAEVALAKLVGSELAVAKMPGTGGELVRQDGVTRVTGRGYVAGGVTVQAAEIYFVDGARPPEDGRWLGEADKVSWVDPATGYECIMMRANPQGYLSGYVGVPAGHPLFGWAHEAVPSDLGIEIHGGLTYSRICQDGPSPARSLVVEARRVCHVVIGHVPLRHATDHRAGDGAWWFGFECDHVYDVVPGVRSDRQRFMGAETGAEYRDDAYVIREIITLAAQFKAIADGRSVPAREGPPLPAIGLDPKKGG